MDEDDESSLNYVYYKMDEEGIDYCFRNYSFFREVKDEEFHRLRLAYIKAANDIENYVKSKVSDE